MEIEREICFEVSLSPRDRENIQVLLGEKFRILKDAKLLVIVAVPVSGPKTNPEAHPK